jgi:hypothetical protein
VEPAFVGSARRGGYSDEVIVFVCFAADRVVEEDYPRLLPQPAGFKTLEGKRKDIGTVELARWRLERWWQRMFPPKP